MQEEHDDEDDGHEHCLHHFANAFGDELRRVVDDVVAQPLWEAARQVPHLGDDQVRGRQCVRSRPLKYQEGHRFALVEVAVGAVVLRAELDASHVADARDAPVGIVPDDDIAELAGIDEAAQGLDIELKVAAAPGRRLVEDARGDLHVLRLQRADDLSGHEVARRDLVGVEPDPHRIVAGAEDPHITDAVELRQLVLHLQCRVIRDVELVARRVRRAQVDHHQHVGRVLLHDDTEPLYLLGKLRPRDSDAVLNENLCDIEIGAEGEGDRELQIAVRGRLAAHVEHVLDAVDLLLERGCDGIADDLRRGAGIGRADNNGGRRDLGILRHRQREIGGGADQDDEDRQDRGEDRPVDEEMR